MENTPFGGFGAGLCPQNRLAAVGRIRASGVSAAIFAELEFTGLLYIMHFADESPGYSSLKSGRSTSLRNR
jgi:hypothetical protein